MSLSGRDLVADWIEVGMLTRASASIGLDALANYFVDELGVETARFSLGMNEMSRRAKVLGRRYPFEVVDGVAVKRLPDAARSPYAVHLLLAPGGPVREFVASQPTVEMAIIFENLAAEACASLWGDAGAAIRFGWPSEIGRPREFGPAVAWLAKELGIQVGSGYRQPRRKDGGVDVVAWRSFGDGKPGIPLLLVQCTLQDNLTAKGMDVDARLWGSWLSLDVDPMVTLATPRTLLHGVEWRELALKYMVLDRVRLVLLAPDAPLKERSHNWAHSTVEILRDHFGDLASQ